MLARTLRFLGRPKADTWDRPWEIEFDETCSEEDVYYCFRLILGRSPVEAEWDGHRSLAGHNLRDVVSVYLSSREFKNRGLNVLSDTEHIVVDLKGYKMYVSTSDTAVGVHISALGSWEPHVTQAIKQWLAPGMYFIDVGANIGYFTLLAAHLVGEEGRVFAFEPYQYNVKLLYLNARINGFENIEIYPFAVADKRSLLAYDNMASNGVVTEIRDDINSLLSTTLVYAVRIDDVLRDIDRLDVIKIDVEGAEYLVLNGGRNLLRKHRPAVFSEFSPPALETISRTSAETYLQLLLVDKDYRITVLDKRGEVIDCKADIGKVIECFENANTDHIDVVAYPYEVD